MVIFSWCIDQQKGKTLYIEFINDSITIDFFLEE